MPETNKSATIDLNKGKIIIPIAAIAAVLVSVSSYTVGLASERGQVLEKVERLERDVRQINKDIGGRLHRMEATVNRIEALVNRQENLH